MTRSWTSFGRQFGAFATRYTVSGSAKVIGQLRNNGIFGLFSADGTPKVSAANATTIPGRPIVTVHHPTAERARPVIYAPHLDGPADAGEVVWAWVVTGPDPNGGSDEPVLVVGREESMLLGLLVSRTQPRRGDPRWVDIGEPGWQHTDTHWIRTDVVFDVPEAGIRREGAVLDRSGFDKVAHRLCSYGWR